LVAAGLGGGDKKGREPTSVRRFLTRFQVKKGREKGGGKTGEGCVGPLKGVRRGQKKGRKKRPSPGAGEKEGKRRGATFPDAFGN